MSTTFFRERVPSGAQHLVPFIDQDVMCLRLESEGVKTTNRGDQITNLTTVEKNQSRSEQNSDGTYVHGILCRVHPISYPSSQPTRQMTTATKIEECVWFLETKSRMETAR